MLKRVNETDNLKSELEIKIKDKPDEPWHYLNNDIVAYLLIDNTWGFYKSYKY